jgi:magnesium-transporting ATPase (P-type)
LLQEGTTVVKLDGVDEATVGIQLKNLCKTFGAIHEKKNLLLQALDQVTSAAHLVAGAVMTIGSIALHGAKPRGLEPRPGNDSSFNLRDGHPTRLKDGSGKLALVITGKALEFILENENRERDFVNLGQILDVVIACRVSPVQKAFVVRLMRYKAKSDSTKMEQPMTLAIGDGANDVGMLLEAHLGIGISGKEGMQAVNNSDFAIAQFRFLRRLLLIHGRWSYLRSSRVFLYSFYKNVVLVFTMYWFFAYSAYSGQTLFTDWIYAGYNFYLGWPVIGIGLFNQDITVCSYCLQSLQFNIYTIIVLKNLYI